MKAARNAGGAVAGTQKVATGIAGFDECTGGGLPRGRVSVLLGGPGAGKTIFALQTLAAGARRGSVGIFVAFEERTAHIRENIARFDWNLGAKGGRAIELFDAQLADTVLHGGDFDLIGLLAMLGRRAKQIGADRIVFDGVDVLLGLLREPALARREMFRLRDWIHQSGLTGILTAKAARTSDAGSSVDHEYLEFMADCVVTLEHVLLAGTALRMLRVAKLRGDAHSANELPFTIARSGINVGDASSFAIVHSVSKTKITSGVAPLDAMLGGGFYRGSSVLITGSPGTAKTSLAASFAAAACRRKERTLLVSFDEAPEQIIRNMTSIGIRLEPFTKSKLLTICSLRSRGGSPEDHIARIRALMQEHGARNLVVDPISGLTRVHDDTHGGQAAIQLLDLCKSLGITILSTSLQGESPAMTEHTPISVSTIADTWLHVANVSRGGERNRTLSVVKSRGTGHSNQVRELILTDQGVTMADVYAVGGEVFMGTLRWEKENDGRRARETARRSADLRQKEAELALAGTIAHLETLRVEQAVREVELERVKVERAADTAHGVTERRDRVVRRGGEAVPVRPRKRKRPTIKSRASQ